MNAKHDQVYSRVACYRGVNLFKWDLRGIASGENQIVFAVLP
jgi:hypothetical protein